MTHYFFIAKQTRHRFNTNVIRNQAFILLSEFIISHVCTLYCQKQAKIRFEIIEIVTTVHYVFYRL